MLRINTHVQETCYSGLNAAFPGIVVAGDYPGIVALQCCKLQLPDHALADILLSTAKIEGNRRKVWVDNIVKPLLPIAYVEEGARVLSFCF